MFQYCSPDIPADDVSAYNDDNMDDPSPVDGVHHLERLEMRASHHWLLADEYQDVEPAEDTVQRCAIWYARDATTREEFKDSEPKCRIEKPEMTQVCTIAPSVFDILLSSPTL